MSLPIVIDGTTSIIAVNTRQLTSPIIVQLPVIDLGGKLITVVDTGGMADTKNITIQCIGGTQFSNGTTSVIINTKNGSVSFGQSSTSIFVLSQTVIRGNTDSIIPRIIISTPFTFFSTVTSKSSMIVYNNLAAGNLILGGTVLALGGFKPSISDSNVTINYLSAITISTGAISVGSVGNDGGFATGDTFASTVFVSSSYNTVSLDSTRELLGQSSFMNSLFINGNSLYGSNSNLYLNDYKINNDTIFLVPQFLSSVTGLMSVINIGVGVSSLSTSIVLISTTYNPNPGFSTLSTFIAGRLPLISGADTSTLFGLVSTSLSTTNAVTGLSSLSSIISYGLSSLVLPFSLSSLITVVQQGVSSVVEFRSISTLTFDLGRGLSSVNQNTGIDELTNNTKSLLSSSASSALFSTVSTNLGYGFCNLNLTPYLSTFYGSASTSFCNLVIGDTLSSFSSLVVNISTDINFYSGLSSLSTTIGHGFTDIDVRAQISTLSTSIAQGLSSVNIFSRQISSLSTSVVLQISTLHNPGISSLLNDLSRGSSIVFAGHGLSSFSQYQSSHFYNMTASPGLSSLSTIFVLGISTVIRNINPSSFIYFSTLFTSSIAMSNTGLRSGNLLIDNNILTVNNHSVTPPNNNFEVASSISTFSVFVGSTFTSFGPLTPSSLTIQELRTSSILSGEHIAESTITFILNIKDAVTTQIHEFATTNTRDILFNRSSLFYNEYIGLSSLSTVLAPSLSSISTYATAMNSISSALSTLALALPRICTLSTLFAYNYQPEFIERGVSTVSSFISTLWVSTFNVSFMNLTSTFTSSVVTSSFSASNVSSFAMGRGAFSFFAASTITAEQSFISSFAIGIQTSSISTIGLAYTILNTQNIRANSFYTSSLRGNIVRTGALYLKDNSASYITPRPLENSTFYELYAQGGLLRYNSTFYGGGGFDAVATARAFSTNILTVSTVISGTIYTSSMTFSGKVQFDRLVVRQSTVTPYFYATETGVYAFDSPNGDWRSYNYLFRSVDGITWQRVNTPNTSWVGKEWNAGFGSSSGYSLAWNGNVLIAYSDNNGNRVGNRPFLDGNPQQQSGMNSNCISYDGGFTWSYSPRYAVGETRFDEPGGQGNPVQVKILWANNRWWRFNPYYKNAPVDSISYTSPDGLTWTRFTWVYDDGGNVSQTPFAQGAGQADGSARLANVVFNGTTMILSMANGMQLGNQPQPPQPHYLSNQCVVFTDDFVNVRPMVNGNTLGTNFTDCNMSVRANPWSDGHAWWFPNQIATGRSAIARVYPWRQNSDGVNTGTTQALLYCFGIGVALNHNTIPQVLSGHYNGYMHVCGRGQETNTAINLSSLNIIYSYDGVTWFANRSVRGTFGNVQEVLYANNVWVVCATGNGDGANENLRYNCGAGLLYSFDGLNWDTCKGQIPVCGTFINNPGSIGAAGGGHGIMYMSNTTPSIDFDGIRIYNHPGGLGWTNPVTREQSIIAAQSSILIHNTLTINTDISPGSCSTNNVTRVGILDLNPSTTLDLGFAATVTAERLVTNSFYVSTNSLLPLSTFNLYVNGSTFLQNLALNVPKPVTVVDISGANALFRSRGNANTPSNAKGYFTTYTELTNTILGPSMLANSTAMTLYYNSGGTNYRRSYGGSNFFTGQHASLCLDLSGALVSSIVSTLVTDMDGKDEISFSTIWTDYSGFLVSSADDGYLSIPGRDVKLFGANAINIIEALPKTRITRKQKDPAVFGVVTNNANASYKEDGSVQLDSDTDWGNDLCGRIRVNSIGEGAIWVTNTNGNIDNGDYLCSSEISGHAEKQGDDYMYNYTVAKATISCGFDLSSSNYRCEEILYNGSTFLRAYIGCTYHCG